MTKKIRILVFVFIIAICSLTISTFAKGKENTSSQMPFIATEEITPEQPDIQTEADLIEQFEEMFGEGSGKILSIAMVGVFIMPLFIPALIVVIVFSVLNGKNKKKIKEYERFFGPVPQNMPNPYDYQSQPINIINAPMGTAPAGNTYIPQNDVNNQQGGSSDEKN